MTKRNLLLNFVPVTLTGETRVRADRYEYSAETLRELRRRNHLTHIFHYSRQEGIVLGIPVAADASVLTSTNVEIDLKETFWLWPSLLNAALLRTFAGKREIADDYPVSVLGGKNLIQHHKLPNWVLARTLQIFTPRTLFDRRDKPIFGLTCDIAIRHQLAASCHQLQELGFPLQGQQVVTDAPARDSRLQQRNMLVGRVASIDGSDLVLADHREGWERISVNEARLTGRHDVLAQCIGHLLGGEAGSELARLDRAAAEIHRGPGRLKAIKEVFEFLRKADLAVAPGVTFHIGDMLGSAAEHFPVTETIAKPILQFDPAGTHTSHWNEGGIRSHGPYDQRTFTPKRLNIAVICQARFEGQVDAFVAKFLDGMPDVLTRGTARYGDGFQRRFRLEKANVQTFTAGSASSESYETACRNALQAATDNGLSWDLALVQIEEKFKLLPGAQNPYYATKAVLLKNNVPVQGVRLETMSIPDANMVFTMNQISLQSYAKIGGVPWLLAAQQRVAHELVIGLGSHSEKVGSFGSGERFVGITTVFSSDGSYLLSDRTNAVPFDGYAAALTETLRTNILRIREQDNWRSTDKVRLIFHIFKPLKDVEADAIKEVVAALRLENVTYAFVHIAEDHPLVVIDLDQEGIGFGDPKKGVLGPERGLHLKLSDYESLVVFAGAADLKKASDGLPRGCLLKLHRNSTFRDMTYLARQAFDFSAHSWRIMFPEKLPITIKYSDLIAERLTGLRQVPHWDDDAIRFRDIGTKLWFL